MFMPLPEGSINPSQDVLSISHNKHDKFIIDCYREIKSSGGSYRVNKSSGVGDVLDRLPEAKRVKTTIKNPEGYYEAWEVAATDTNIELINALVPRVCLQFVNDEAEAHWEAITHAAQLADIRAVVASEYKAHKTVPTHNYEFSADSPLSGYQQTALYLQQLSAGFGLFMEQGTGKTPVGIAAICNGVAKLRAEGSKRFYLVAIVCPNSVRANWCEELSHFSTRGGRVTVMRGTQIDRVKLLSDAIAPDETGEVEFSAVIMGYQTLWRSWEAIKLLPWDLTILDEAQAIKDEKAEQSKSCIALRDASRQRIAMTGTPIANSALDLYNILEFLEKGGSGFSSRRAFNKFYGQYTTGDSGYKILTGMQNLPLLQERLVRNSFFISKKEALPDLPDTVHDIVEIEMTDQQAKAYEDLSNQLALEIENTLATGGLTRQLVVTNILTKLLRLSQITSGFIAWDAVEDENGEVIQPKSWEYFPDNPKIAALCDLLLQKDPTEKTIIWANWIPDIEYIYHCCNELGIKAVKFTGSVNEEERQIAINSFNEDRDTKVFVGTAGSGGAGLNLIGYPPHAGDDYDTDCTHIIYYSMDWSSIKRSQSAARAHRRGTRRNVRITDLMVPRSIDEQIRIKVMGKQMHAIEVSDLRKIMNAALGKKD